MTSSRLGDSLFFAADDGEHGRELWRTDGTAEGTVLVSDIRPGRASAKPEDLIAAEDQLFFTARDAEHGRELWRTDGPAEDTVLVSDIESGEEGSLLGDFAVLGDRLYFADWGTRGVEYQSDGTEVGTFPIGSDQAGAPVLGRRASESASTVKAEGRLFFPADDGTHGTELWTTDGTVGGTTIVADLRPGSKGSEPAWLVVAEGYLYFTVDDGDHGRQVRQLPVADA